MAPCPVLLDTLGLQRCIILGGIFSSHWTWYEFDKDAEKSWAKATCTVHGTAMDERSGRKLRGRGGGSSGSGGRGGRSSGSSKDRKRKYYKVSFNVTVHTSDPVTVDFIATANRFPSWTQSPRDFDGGNWKTKRFAHKSEAIKFQNQFKVGEQYGCYFNPDDPMDVAMRSDGGAWIFPQVAAGIALLSCAACACCVLGMGGIAIWFENFVHSRSQPHPQIIQSEQSNTDPSIRTKELRKARLAWSTVGGLASLTRAASSGALGVASDFHSVGKRTTARASNLLAQNISPSKVYVRSDGAVAGALSGDSQVAGVIASGPDALNPRMDLNSESNPV